MQGEQMLTGPIVNERKILIYGGKGVKVFSVVANHKNATCFGTDLRWV